MARCAAKLSASLTLLSLCSPTNVAQAAHAVPMANVSHTLLPAVDSVMTRAMGKAMDFAEQAKEMQRRVAQRQEESKTHLELTKAKYEQSLVSQAQEYQRLGDVAARLNASILVANQTNIELLKASEKLQRANAHLRKTLQIIQGKVTAAQDFLDESMRDTDDTGAEELKIMAPTTPKPTLDQFLRVAISNQKDDLQGIEAPSLLQIASHFRSRRRHGAADPSDLVEVLAASLGDIAAAQKEGEAQLKKSFLASFDFGQKRYEALDESNKRANATLIALTKVGDDLAKAKQHLEATHKDLQQRLVGLRKFAAKVDASSLAALSIPEKPAVTRKSGAAAAHGKTASQKRSQGSSIAGVHSLLAEGAQVQKPKAAAKKPVAPAKKPAGAKPAPAGAKAAAVPKAAAKPAHLARAQNAGGAAVHAQPQKLDVQSALAHATKAVVQASEAEMAAQSPKGPANAGAGAKGKPLKKAPAAQANKATAAKAPGKTEAAPLKGKPPSKTPAAQASKTTAAKAPSKTEAPAKRTAQHVASKPEKVEKVPAQAATKTEDTKATWRSWLSSWR